MHKPYYIRTLILSVLMVIGFTKSILSQIDSIDYTEFPFIEIEKNRLHNDSSLYPFFDKLTGLSPHNQDVVNVLHIGDSHIQADFFSGKIREYLQIRYGNAGRGLIFPYRAAGSNEPSDIKSIAYGGWLSKRNVHVANPLPIGISGFTLHTEEFFAKLCIKIQSRIFDYSFNEITLFHQKGDSCFDFAIYDEYKHKIGFVNSSDREKNRFTSTIKLDKLINEVCIETVKTSNAQYFTNIYGLQFKNNYHGVLYNTIAANGAAVYHYNQSKYFAEQLHAINPDLIIISLGSNEALNPPFFRKFFKKQLEGFTSSLKASNPDVCLLFTTPPDSYLKKKFRNKNVANVREEIVNFCNAKNIAYWDLFEITGGYASMDQWTRYRLSQPDKIHYTAKGYHVQANLFLMSFEKSLKRFENNYR